MIRISTRACTVALAAGLAWPAPAAAAPTESNAERGQPRLHLEVSGRAAAALYRLPHPQDPELDEPRKICEAPCDTKVDGRDGAQFVVDGPRMLATAAFTLWDKPSDVTLLVRPGRRVLAILGWTFVAIGGVAILAGGVTLTFADDDRRIRRAGAFTLLGALPLAAGGGLMASFGHTRYRFAPAGHERPGKHRRRR